MTSETGEKKTSSPTASCADIQDSSQRICLLSCQCCKGNQTVRFLVHSAPEVINILKGRFCPCLHSPGPLWWGCRKLRPHHSHKRTRRESALYSHYHMDPASLQDLRDCHTSSNQQPEWPAVPSSSAEYLSFALRGASVAHSDWDTLAMPL